MTERRLWRDYQELQNQKSDSQDRVNFYDANSQNIKKLKDQNPIISVVIPAFNESKLLPRALAGINNAIADLDTSVEVLVVDNASTDDTYEIAKYFGACVFKEPKKGIGQARQTGLDKTNISSKYILTTDADSLVTQNWVINHYQNLTDPSTVFTFGDIIFCLDGNNSFKDQLMWNLFQSMIFIKHKIGMKSGIMAGGSNNGFNKEVAIHLGGYDTALARKEDSNLMNRLASTGKISRIDNATVLTSNRRVVNNGIGKCIFNQVIYSLLPQLRKVETQTDKYEDIRL